MSGAGLDENVEWLPSARWALSWLAFHLLVALPFLALGGWLAANEIAGAPEGTWPAYLFFLGAFAALVLGALTLAVLSGVTALLDMLLRPRPVLVANRDGIEVRMPHQRLQRAKWADIDVLEIERTRRIGRRDYQMNQVVVRLRDGATFAIRPQAAGLTLEAGHAELTRLHAKFR